MFADNHPLYFESTKQSDMKTNAILIALLGVSAFAMSCEKENIDINPTTNISSRDYSINNFTDLVIEDPFTAYITFSSSEESLRIEANDNLHAFIDVEESGGTLKISLEDDVNLRSGNVVLKIYLTTKDVATIEATGASNVFLQNELIRTSLDLEISGASNFQGSLQVDQLNVFLNGASNVDIDGSAHRMDIQAIGGCNMTDFDFSTDLLYADLTGASNVSATVNEKLEVEASGASNVYYKGNGVIDDLDISGGSNVIKVE